MKFNSPDKDSVSVHPGWPQKVSSFLVRETSLGLEYSDLSCLHLQQQFSDIIHYNPPKWSLISQLNHLHYLLKHHDENESKRDPGLTQSTKVQKKATYESSTCQYNLDPDRNTNKCIFTRERTLLLEGCDGPITY